MFNKTYLERRSWAAIFRAFYRIYSLQAVMIVVLFAYAFEGRSITVRRRGDNFGWGNDSSVLTFC